VLLGPAGDNTLDARVENDYGQEADTRTMDPAGTRTVVLDLGPPRVVFGGSLADGQLSAADDPDLSDGFQVDVPLQVQDDEDSTMAEVALFVRLDGEVAEAEEPGKELVALAGGGPFEQEVVFEGVMLGRGTYHLRATAVDRAGNTVEQTQMVTVDIAVPGVTITSPLDGACAADGTATEVAVAVTDLDGAGQAVLLVDGVEGGSEAVADGQASITLDLDAGTMALQVRVDPAAGNPGFSRVHTFTVKPNAPSVEFDFTDLEEDWVDRDPGTGAVTEVRLNLAAPGETRPDEYRLDLRVLGGDLSPDQEATLTLDCGAGEEEWQATADEEGAFEFLRVTTPLEGQCQATVNTTDCAGQAAPALSTTLRVDRVPPVARVVFAFLGDDRVITPAHDKAPELEGIQKHISCYASGITPPVDVCLHRLRSDGDEARDCKQLPADEEPPNRERVALFRDVTFLPIDPEPEGGTGYAVWCSTTDPMDNPSDPTASREQVSVRTQTPKLSWVQPWVEGMEEDEVVLWGQAQDMEVDIDGFQGDFRLATENVPARTAGWLCSDHASVAGRECTGGTSHALHANAREVGADGFLRFAGIPLAEGTHNVFAEIELPGASRSPEIPVVVDVTAPTIGDFRTTSNVIPSLQDGGPDEFINMEEDEDPAAGIQAAFVADVNAGPEDCVADLECLLLLRNDRSADALGSVEFTGEAASLTVTLAEGVPQSLTAVVRDAAGNESAPSQAIPLEADGSPPSLTIVRPEDGAFLLPNDPDVSAADLPGDDVLTYAARFSPQQATSVELFLNPANEQEPVVDPDETLVGQPWTQDVAFLDGVGNALVAIAYDRASNPDREAVHVTAEAHMPTVRFLDPQQGSPEAPTRYEEDADPNAGRFQIDVTVETTNVPDGGTVEIISNWDGVVSDRRTALVVDGDTGIGTADVRCSMRHSGPHTLTARVRAAFGAQGEHEVVVDSEQDVYVHIAVLGCGIQITEPETAYINAQMAGEPGPGGEVEVEVDVRVTAADPFPCTDQMAHLYVDRVRQVALSRLVPADGIIWEGATVTLHEGDNLLEVYLGDKDQPEDALTVHVDLDPPTVAFANLEGDPAPLGVRHDLDGEQAGLQYDFTFTVTDAEGGTLVLDDDDDSHYGNADPDPDPPLGRLDELSDDDVQSLRGVTLAVGQHTLRVWVYDRAGNEGMDGPLTAVVDVTAPSAPADLEATLAHPRLPTVELTFGASSDDADGAAAVSSYDVRYAKAPITENGFDSACPYAPDVEPLAPPAEQTLQVSGPIPASGEQCPDAFRIGADEVEGTFHFAVRATDDVGNTSAVAPLADPVVGTFRQHVFDSPGPSGWGSRLAGLGDVNGDGRDDLGVTSSDFAHVVYGADDPEDSVIQEIGSGGWYGYNLAGLGDVDGDGIDDFAVGDSGTVGIFLGSDGGQVSTDPVQTIALDANWAWGNVWFESVAGAGDFNSVLPEGGARRYNDIVIGLIDAAADAQSAAFVVLGRAREDWPGGQLRVSDDAATNAANGVVRFTVGAGSGYLGVQVAGVGDGDNDGYADILVGSSHAAVGEEVDVGTAYLVRGRAYDRQNLANPPPNPWTLLADTGRVTPIRPVQGGPGGHFSESLAGGLDLTGDGLPDFSIASRLGGRVRVYDGATVEALYAAEEAAGEDPVRVDPLEVTTLPWFRAGWPFHWWTNVDGNVDEDGDPEPDLFFSTENGEVGTAGVVLRSGHRFLRRGPLFTDQAEGYGKRVAPVGRFAGGDSHVDLVLGSPNREEVILLY